MYTWLGGVLRCHADPTGDTLLPPPPPHMSEDTGDSDWDTNLVVCADMLNVPLERRHSGWEAVEKKWTEKQEQQQRQPGGSKLSTTKGEEACVAMEHFPYPQMSIPIPHVEFDFRMKVVLSAQVALVSVNNDGSKKKLATVTDGMFSGHFGHGVVINGGQESRDIFSEKTVTTQVEAFHRLQTGDEPPAYIECKAQGCRTGTLEVMKALEQTEPSEQADPRLCQYRMFITMKTSDERYAEKLNGGLWIGSCLWKGLEVVYDAYRIT